MFRIIYLPTAEYIKHLFIDSPSATAVFDCEDKQKLLDLLTSEESGIYPFAASGNHEYKFQNSASADYILIKSKCYSGSQPKHLFDVVEV